MLLLVLISYLFGSLPFGIWVVRLLLGRDIRAGGSGHTGATNTFRQVGWRAGLAVAMLDIGKGASAAWLSQILLPGNPWAPVLATAGVVAGHCWPILAGFRGGMGLAALGGTMLVFSPSGFVLGVALAVSGTLLLRHTARGNILAGITYGPVFWFLSGNFEVALAASVGGLLVAARSLSNWNRRYHELWLDREPPTQAT
jgi:acyl phosphate:glycerol-3-phosphate acyltransferase